MLGTRLRNMEWRDVAMVTMGLLGAVGGWIMRTQYAILEALRAEVAEFKRHVPEEYVRLHDYRDDMQYIRDKLDTIVERLPSKEQ